MQEIALSMVKMTKRYREFGNSIAHRNPYGRGRGAPVRRKLDFRPAFSAKASSQAAAGVKFTGPFDRET
jgi:hypothetical protein